MKITCWALINRASSAQSHHTTLAVPENLTNHAYWIIATLVRIQVMLSTFFVRMCKNCMPRKKDKEKKGNDGLCGTQHWQPMLWARTPDGLDCQACLKILWARRKLARTMRIRKIRIDDTRTQRHTHTLSKRTYTSLSLDETGTRCTTTDTRTREKTSLISHRSNRSSRENTMNEKEMIVSKLF